MGFCTECGNGLGSNDKYCSVCGSPIQLANAEKAESKYQAKVDIEKKETGPSLFARASDRVTDFKKKVGKPILMFLLGGGALFTLLLIGYEMREGFLVRDRDQSLQALNNLIQSAQEQSHPDSGTWKFYDTDDPASGRTFIESASVISNDGLCFMSIQRRLGGKQLTSFKCLYEFLNTGWNIVKFKFDNQPTVYEMTLHKFSGQKNFRAEMAGYIAPMDVCGKGVSDVQCMFNMNDRVEQLRSNPSLLTYEKFISLLSRSAGLAVQVHPTVTHELYSFDKPFSFSSSDWKFEDLGPTWVGFKVEGAGKAIAKLGQQRKQ